MATGSIFVAALALPEEQSVAGGPFIQLARYDFRSADIVAVFQTLIQLGGSFGIAITTVISTAYHEKALSNGLQPVDAQLEGLHAAFWLGAGFSGCALIIAIVMLRGMGAIGKVKKEKEIVGGSESDMPEVAEKSDGRGEKV